MQWLRNIFMCSISGTHPLNDRVIFSHLKEPVNYNYTVELNITVATCDLCTKYVGTSVI